MTTEMERRQTLWDKRYTEEGHIWGDEPSMTARIVADTLTTSNNNLVEVGFGYGRDVIELVQNGHHVTGIEESLTGFNEAGAQILARNKRSQAILLWGEFTRAGMPTNYYDAMLSHRMLHLLGDNGLVRAFANKAAKILKPDGLLCISARDKRDFDSEQMKERADGRYEYTIEGREGHIINLWDENLFREVFERYFHIERFYQGEEIESQKNANKNSHFTIMVARKKNPAVDGSQAHAMDTVPSATYIEYSEDGNKNLNTEPYHTESRKRKTQQPAVSMAHYREAVVSTPTLAIT